MATTGGCGPSEQPSLHPESERIVKFAVPGAERHGPDRLAEAVHLELLQAQPTQPGFPVGHPLPTRPPAYSALHPRR
ncbi:Nucleosomal histone H3-Lys79 methylase [Puccinia graminis f. sp. tritici]|uniref:Nucleosomal histone H3-Lys79 methylase n=1 Tax=Puccinia graminis f. sp. tritici TaxID=56615 RepID=A0A5B0MBH7_PUCGR|nr:Nucleosomal histone H3-Lys79 methylase [Puccinia graminis f. sp. tritici]